MNDIGINAKLPDLLSYMLLPQIRDINKNLLKKKKIYNNYVSLLKNLDIFIPKLPKAVFLQIISLQLV